MEQGNRIPDERRALPQIERPQARVQNRKQRVRNRKCSFLLPSPLAREIDALDRRHAGEGGDGYFWQAVALQDERSQPHEAGEVWGDVREQVCRKVQPLCMAQDVRTRSFSPTPP